MAVGAEGREVVSLGDARLSLRVPSLPSVHGQREWGSHTQAGSRPP